MEARDDRETQRAVAVVGRWHDALNHSDIDALVALCRDDVEVIGPRGSGRGAAVLRDWAARAGIRLQPRAWYGRGQAVVVEQSASWRGPDGAYSEPLLVATAFLIADGRIRRIARRDTLGDTLRDAGLTREDRLEWPPGEPG